MAQLSADCFAHGGTLMSLEDALALIDRRTETVADVEHVSLKEALGRILAQDVVAPGDVDGLANTLRRLARAPDERDQLGDSGRAAAVANFDRKQLCDDFIREIEK